MNKGRFKESHGGWTRHRGTYQTWLDMRQRCQNPNAAQFRNYGARGITVCSRWSSFTNFFEDMGPRPMGSSLDRINNDGDYSPENCRWAARKQQRINQRGCVLIPAFGQSLTATDWSSRTGLHRDTIIHRIRKGISPEIALSLTKMPGKKLTARKEARQ